MEFKAKYHTRKLNAHSFVHLIDQSCLRWSVNWMELCVWVFVCFKQKCQCLNKLKRAKIFNVYFFPHMTVERNKGRWRRKRARFLKFMYNTIFGHYKVYAYEYGSAFLFFDFFFVVEWTVCVHVEQQKCSSQINWVVAERRSVIGGYFEWRNINWALALSAFHANVYSIFRWRDFLRGFAL